MALAGFPHSGTPGSKAVCASPGLIAACRALRRLPVPRHPPCAFDIFSHIFYGYPYRDVAIVLMRPPSGGSSGLTFVSSKTLCNCQGARGGSPGSRMLGTQGAARAASRRFVVEKLLVSLFGRALGPPALSRLPRKEVIQPHLPVRLPCYDFTPLTLHTFDASAPCGFGRRLRVQTTRVV